LESDNLSKKRVQFRVKNKGHYVPGDEIERRYKNGLLMLDDSFARYDKLILIESFPGFRNKTCLGLRQDEGYLVQRPSFLNHLPKLEDHIKDLKQTRSIGFNL
tara:strand:- start:596 stop:904 length:309 start_codon:yes stop_codon:yes gene_type:complete